MTTIQAPSSGLKPYTKKELVGDQPTWCPGCGDFSILATYFKLLEKRQIPREKIISIAGIGCSSRFPYFVNAYGVHFVHGPRAIPRPAQSRIPGLGPAGGDFGRPQFYGGGVLSRADLRGHYLGIELVRRPHGAKNIYPRADRDCSGNCRPGNGAPG